MSKNKNARKEKLLRVWEQVVLEHKKWRENPSAQCMWTLVKLIAGLLFRLLMLYIASR